MATISSRLRSTPAVADGDQRRAERVGEGEDRHQRAGRRRRDAEVGGDLRQHAGDHERLGADGEGAEDEGEETEHGRVLDQFNGSLNWGLARREFNEFNNC